MNPTGSRIEQLHFGLKTKALRLLLRKYLGRCNPADRGRWYIRRTGAKKANWDALGGDYFVAPWERRTMKPGSG
jgi:hypothetical protein